MKKILVFLLFLFTTVVVKGQTVREIEDKMYDYTQLIYKWDTTKWNEDQNDSLAKANKDLLDYLSKVLVSNKATLSYDFKKITGTGIQILSSDDKKFRIYCWDVGGERGVARSYNVLIQYKGNVSTGVKIVNDASKEKEGDVCSGLFIYDLYTIPTKSGKSIYLTIGNEKVAMGLYYSEVNVYTIERGKLNDSIKVFKTPTEALNSISFACDLAGTVNKHCPQFKMSNNKQKLYVPIIKENDEITQKFLVYKFDGNNYVFDKGNKQ